MNNIKSFLTELDLTEKEAATYLALLELGKQPASVIAKKINEPRSSTFLQLKNLIRKGFSSSVIDSKKITYFMAIPPEKIKDILKQKQKSLDHKLDELDGFLPGLKSLTSDFIPQSQVSYHEGTKGLCNMIDLLSEEDIPVYFISGHDLHPQISKYINDTYAEKRRKMKNKCQMIISQKSESQKYIRFAKGVYEWVGYAITEKGHPLKSTIAIYGNKVQFLNCNGPTMGGVLIENDYLSKTMLALFMLLKNTKKVIPIS